LKNNILFKNDLKKNILFENDLKNNILFENDLKKNITIQYLNFPSNGISYRRQIAISKSNQGLLFLSFIIISSLIIITSSGSFLSRFLITSHILLHRKK
jgi:hypothetical protein